MSKENAVKGFGIFFIVWSILTLIGAAFGAIVFGVMMALNGMSGGDSSGWIMLGTGLVDIIGGCWLMYAGILVTKRKRSAPLEVTIASGIYILSNLYSPIAGMIGMDGMSGMGFLAFGFLGMIGSAIGVAFWGFIMWYFNQPRVKAVLNK